MNVQYCPICYTKGTGQTETCQCGYPFNGNEIQKQEFVASRIKKVRSIAKGNEHAKYSRIVLFIVGGLNVILSLFVLIGDMSDELNQITLVAALVMIGLGFYSYQEPFLALLLGFIVLLLIYGLYGLLYPEQLLNGFFLKVFIIISFVYGLIKVKQGESSARKLFGE